MPGANWYSALIEYDYEGPVDDDLIDGLFDVFAVMDVSGVSISGREGHTLSVRFSVEAEDPASVGNHAVHVMHEVAMKADIALGEFHLLQVQTQAALEAELNEPPQRYAGITEVAGILGVSKQRVSELRSSGRLPAPVAEIKAGPVWTVSSLERFLDQWDRRPGRRVTVKPGSVKVKGGTVKVSTKKLRPRTGATRGSA